MASQHRQPDSRAGWAFNPHIIVPAGSVGGTYWVNEDVLRVMEILLLGLGLVCNLFP